MSDLRLYRYDPQCLDQHAHHGEITVAEIPWCAEHDDKWSDSWTPCYAAKVLCVDRTHAPCRLEEPARHYVVKEAECEEPDGSLNS